MDYVQGLQDFRTLRAVAEAYRYQDRSLMRTYALTQLGITPRERVPEMDPALSPVEAARVGRITRRGTPVVHRGRSQFER